MKLQASSDGRVSNDGGGGTGGIGGDEEVVVVVQILAVAKVAEVVMVP